MNDRDTTDIMLRCAEEIQQLRARIATLEPKAAAYDSIECILGLLPRKTQGYGEDLVWRLRKEAEAMRANSEKPADGAA